MSATKNRSVRLARNTTSNLLAANALSALALAPLIGATLFTSTLSAAEPVSGSIVKPAGSGVTPDSEAAPAPGDGETPHRLADVNGDGEINADDLSDFINAYFFDYPSIKLADVNGDGETNADDLSDFITAYFFGYEVGSEKP